MIVSFKLPCPILLYIYVSIPKINLLYLKFGLFHIVKERKLNVDMSFSSCCYSAFVINLNSYNERYIYLLHFSNQNKC